MSSQSSSSLRTGRGGGGSGRSASQSPQKPSEGGRSQQKGGAGANVKDGKKKIKDDKKAAKMERRAKALAAKGDAPAGGGGPRPKKEAPVSGSAGKEQRGTASEQQKPQGKAPRPMREKSLSTSEDVKKVQLFSHLHQYERKVAPARTLGFFCDGIHPAIVRLAVQYSYGTICGSNARCIALLGAFRKVIQDYTTPPDKTLSRDLEMTIKPLINYLTKSRPLSVSMGNAIKFMKFCITSIPPDMPENEAKEKLCSELDNYLQEKILLADEAISKSCRTGIIKDGDVILVYAFSSIVLKALTEAHRDNIKFRVIVVDSRPKMEGKVCLVKLLEAGITCSYVLINAVPYIMKEVSKVIVGAHALLANGYVMSRVGTALISLIANSYNIPVLVCCETHKFSDKVQTDAFVQNELSDPNDLVPINRRHGDILSTWESIPSLGLLNLTYDVTSPDLIAMVITEVGNIPCTSVPVILRISQQTV